MRRLGPSGEVTGFGPYNEDVQRVIDHAVDRAVTRGAPLLVHQFRVEVLPAVLADRQLQETLGRSAGDQVARKIALQASLLCLGVGVIAASCGYLAYRVWDRG
jgi:hypothetical protein